MGHRHSTPARRRAGDRADGGGTASKPQQGGGGGTAKAQQRTSAGTLRAPRPADEVSPQVPNITEYGGDVRQKYDIDKKVIGEGHYGTVRRCQDKQTKEWYALKTIKKLKVKRVEYLRREIQILMSVNHPNVIKVRDIFEDKYNLHIVTELCTGGELFQRIIEKSKSKEGHFSEHDASTLVRKILSAIEHMHNEHDIVHRDLKPENFLFRTKGADAEPVIIDFGLSKTLDSPDDHMATRVGTPYYIAPEVLNRNYDKGCDIWSIGVISYILLCGYPPFYGENDRAIFRSILKGRFDFPEEDWANISKEAKDFIQQLLNLDASARPTASQALQHPWFERAEADPLPLNHSLGAKLGNFVGMNKLKKHALQVIAEHLTQDQIGHMRHIFESLDADKNGVLTLEELREGLIDYPEVASQIEMVLESIDLDGNNSVDYNEFLAATLSRNVFIREENIRVAFDHFDTDGNGMIKYDDLVRIFGSPQHADECLSELNLSQTDAITFESFKSMMQSKNRSASFIHTLRYSRPTAESNAEDVPMDT